LGAQFIPTVSDMFRPSLNIFASKAENYFSPQLSQYGYKLQQTKFFQYSVNLVYHNQNLDRFITLQNAIHGYDHGFTIFVGEKETPERKILLNLPNEKQDSDCAFLRQQ
jgi:hypothetical protein